jgi:hypothetical protein
MARMVWMGAVLLGLLAVPAYASWGKTKAPVSVHGVNYSNEEFSYTVEDPNDAKNKAGGELINRFAAGGTMCCYDLPKQWTPGLQVKVNSTHWLPKQADGTLPEVKQTFVVEVPPYVDGKPGELWVLRQTDGSVKVVSSDFQPDHEKWPGAVKGWPVPSVEYRRERLALFVKLEQENVDLYRKLLKELEEFPDAHANESWEHAKARHPGALVGFADSKDERYRKVLREEYEAGLNRCLARLKNLQESPR